VFAEVRRYRHVSNLVRSFRPNRGLHTLRASGVARNLLREGQNRGAGRQKSTSGVQGQSPQKLEIYTECITNFIESVIACSNRSKLIGRKNFYPYDGGTCTNPPLATPLLGAPHMCAKINEVKVAY